MTQCDAILDYIKTHGEITQLEALQEIGCMRLASRINDLKRRGVSIEKEWKTHRNLKGHVKWFAAYRLGEESCQTEL